MSLATIRDSLDPDREQASLPHNASLGFPLFLIERPAIWHTFVPSTLFWAMTMRSGREGPKKPPRAIFRILSVQWFCFWPGGYVLGTMKAIPSLSSLSFKHFVRTILTLVSCIPRYRIHQMHHLARRVSIATTAPSVTTTLCHSGGIYTLPPSPWTSGA